MKKISLLFVLILFQISICKAQDFPFVPKNQIQLTDKQLENSQINITPDVLIFNETGEILPSSQLSLMTNPEFKPLFFTDKKGKLKTLVFVKKSKQKTLILQNPEAHFDKGELAKDFIATDIYGNTIKLSELKGKVVVLNFWFTKCGPCIMEMPDLNYLVDIYKNKNVVFLAFSFNTDAIVKQFLETHAFNYTIFANANSITSMYGVQSYPTNIVINQKGEIILKELGYRTNIKEVIKASIDTLL